jgi:hypothetical protein
MTIYMYHPGNLIFESSIAPSDPSRRHNLKPEPIWNISAPEPSNSKMLKGVSRTMGSKEYKGHPFWVWLLQVLVY